MKILVIGGGGREHALVWKLRQSPRVTALYCAPGNAGIANDATCVPLKISDHPALITFAETEKIDLTVVGPDDALGLAERAYHQRRKMLRATLGGQLPEGALEAAGIDPQARPESLGIADWARLAEVVAQ